MMMLTKTVALTSLRELARRRAALTLVLLLPLVFYVVRLDVPWQALRFLAIGVGWAVATLSLFSHVGSRTLDRSLSVIGASPTALFFGRQFAVITTGLAIASIYFVLVAFTQDVPRLPVVALLLLTTVLIAAPLGAVVSLVVPRELEGALALLSIMALQMLVDPSDSATKLLPLWSTRELSSYAIEPVCTATLYRGLAHFAMSVVLCIAIAWVASILRFRPVRLTAPAPDTDEPGMA